MPKKNPLATAFDKFGSKDGVLGEIAENTLLVAETFDEGGEIFDRIDRMVEAIETIVDGTKSGSGGLQEAIVLNLVAPTLKPIGLGMGFIIDALNQAESAEDLTSKFGALNAGLVVLGDIGKSILMFAATMVIGIPILMIAAVTAPVWVGGIYVIIQGIKMATQGLKEGELDKLLILHAIGISIVKFGLLMAAMVLIAPVALIGMLFTVPLLLGVVAIAKYIGEHFTEEALDKFMTFNKAMVMLGLGILSIGLSLALVAVLAKHIIMGLFVFGMVAFGLGAIFMAWEKLFRIDETKAEAYAKSLAFLGIGIITIGLGLMLMNAFAGAIMKGLMVAALVLMVIGGVFFLFQKMGINKTIRKTASGLILAAGAILALSIALALSNLIMPGFLDTMGILMIIGAVALTMFIIGKQIGNVVKGALSLIIMGIGLFALSVGIGFMRLAIPSVEVGIGMIALIGGIGLVFGVIGMAFANVALGGAAMIIAGVALIVLGLGVMAMMASLPTVEEGIGMLLLIGGLGLVFGVAGLAAAFIALGAASMIVAGVALIVIGAGVAIMAAATKDVTMDQVLVMGAIIGGIGVAMAAAGLASPLILLGSVAMTAAGIAVLTISVGMAALAAIDFSKLGTISEKGNKAFNWSGEKGFFGGKKSNFETAMDAIADGMALGPLSILGIMTGAPVMILAGAALTSIALGLRVFTSAIGDTDLPRLSDNVQMIVSGLSETFAEVGASMGGPFWFTSDVYKGIQSTRGMGTSLTGIAKGVQAMAMLRFPTGFDKEGNPTGYETIDLGTAVPNLVANTKLIITGLSSAFAEVGESKAAQGSSWFSSSSYEKGIEVVKQMGTPLFNLAKGVQSMAMLKFPTGFDKDGNATGYKSIGDVDTLVAKLAKNTKALIIGLAGVFEEVGASGVGSGGGWFSSSNFEKGAEIALQLADPYSSLADAVESVATLTEGITDPVLLREKVTSLVETISVIGGFWVQSFFDGVNAARNVKEPYSILASAVTDVTTITSAISDGAEVREKVSAMIESIVGTNDDGVDMGAKTSLIYAIGWTYGKLGVAIPLIVSAITQFTVEKGKAFASIFGGETPAEMYEAKNKMLKTLAMSYMRMAVAIPMIVASVNTVAAEPMNEFTKLYGGVTNDIEVLAAKSTLFEAVGSSYQKIGAAAPQIASAVNGTSLEQMQGWTGMFVGDVGFLRPIAGYNAQTELWSTIGNSLTMGATAFPQISAGINAVDYNKLVESRRMFEALGVLAEGGEPSDILAAMGESLEIAMQRLADILMEFQTSVGESQDAQGGFLSELASLPGKLVGGVADGIRGDGGGGNSAEVVRAVKQLQNALTKTGIKISGNGRLSN
mgnify:CR=1 FL=1|jgi:hypothetical protein